MTTTESTTHQPGLLVSGLALAIFFALSFAAASMSYFFGPDAWYEALNRPAFAPPNWLFGPVWTVLYIGMSVAAWLVWRRVGWRSSLIGVWLIQVALNMLWTPLFFGLHWMGVALAEMGLMWAAIALCVMRFRPISATASWLMVPYLAWVTFAFVLNMAYWWLN
ncbi:MAG: TspO/MBR family protein [Pseudomonadota bacterium]